MRKKLSRKEIAECEEVRVAGIPALAQVHTWVVQPPDRRADNPDDYYGYTELEYTLFDTKGYHAPWLERKLEDRKVEEDVERQIQNQLERVEEPV